MLTKAVSHGVMVAVKTSATVVQKSHHGSSFDSMGWIKQARSPSPLLVSSCARILSTCATFFWNDSDVADSVLPREAEQVAARDSFDVGAGDRDA